VADEHSGVSIFGHIWHSGVSIFGHILTVDRVSTTALAELRLETRLAWLLQ
jgi:hypothetical protein